MFSIGEILSLSTAVVWASAIIFFRKSGETVHPVALNMFKNVLALLLFIPVLYFVGQPIVRAIPLEDYLLLILSGAIGIGLADTVFFFSLNILGAGLSSIVDCFYSPFVIVLSFLWLGERMTPIKLLGVGLILAAVLMISRGEGGNGNLPRKKLVQGVILAIIAMALMAVGIVMIKPLLERSPLLWVTEVRLVGGSVVGGLLLLLLPTRSGIVGSLIKARNWGYILAGSILGANISTVLWLGGMKYCTASISSALNQTSNIFVFIFAALFLKEPVNLRRVLGMALAMTGVFIVTLA